jgi:ribulose-phosphate 3-epimerase
MEVALVKIAPSILSADFARLGADAAAAERGGADLIHVDVMDGHFAPNFGLGPAAVSALRRSTRLPLHTHLMLDQPDPYLAMFAEAGSDLLFVHVEACLHLHRTIAGIRELGLRAGVSLNPTTPLATLEEILPYVDQVLVMSVNPGFSGQAYIPTMTAKIARLAAMIRAAGRPGIEISVDGGIDATTAPEVLRAGASVLVAGHGVFHHPDGIAGGIAALRLAAGAAALQGDAGQAG